MLPTRCLRIIKSKYHLCSTGPGGNCIKYKIGMVIFLKIKFAKHIILTFIIVTRYK